MVRRDRSASSFVAVLAAVLVTWFATVTANAAPGDAARSVSDPKARLRAGRLHDYSDAIEVFSQGSGLMRNSIALKHDGTFLWGLRQGPVCSGGAACGTAVLLDPKNTKTAAPTADHNPPGHHHASGPESMVGNGSTGSPPAPISGWDATDKVDAVAEADEFKIPLTLAGASPAR